MSGLGHILEAAGIATVAIGLVPQHVKTIRPPRALVVPFDLGRPFGAPNNVALQRDVLIAALALLDEDGPGPILKTLAVHMPSVTGDTHGAVWACPVSFPAPSRGKAIADRLLEETGLLMPWFDRGRNLRRRSAADVSGLAVEDLCTWLGKFLEDPTPDESPIAERTLAETFKLSVEDLKAFYIEAATAQPGVGTAEEINNWFWDETAAGELLWQLREKLKKHPDDLIRLHAGLTLVPRAQVARRKARANPS